MFQFNPRTKSLYSSSINDDAFFSGFGTKFMGRMPNNAAVAEYFKSIDCDYSTLAVPVQKHTTNIETVNQKEGVTIVQNTDGLTSNQSGIMLVAWTADCVPIIFADKKNGIVGVSHQGWKGTAHAMAAKMVQSLLQHGAQREHLKIAIGPSIGACCYDITEERAHIFRTAYPQFANKVLQMRDGKIFLNLLYMNVLLLQSEGIPAGNIDFFPFCTRCDEKRFFSFRREGESRGNMISYVMRVK